MIAHGRIPIYTSEKEITLENIRSVIDEAMKIHQKNAMDINFLLEYEKGRQPILGREKLVRSEINNKIVENHASQCVNFKLSHVFGSPIRYVQRSEAESDGNSDTEEDDKSVTALNEYCFEADKHVKDVELAKCYLTCGVGYRFVYPNDSEFIESPFNIVTLDPRTTFIVYSADIFHRPMLGVVYWEEVDDVKRTRHYTAYTQNAVYTFDDLLVGDVECTTNGIGAIPIIEYKQDYDRMGCFERAIGLLDAINVCTSDRINGLAQFIQSFVWFDNVDIDDSNFKALKEAGALKTESKDGKQARIEILASNLNQTEIQTLSDYLYAQFLQICSIPGRGENNGSTTGQSTMLSGGWQEAEEEAHRLEEMFEDGEKRFLKVVKTLLSNTKDDVLKDVKLKDIDIKFSRNKISNMLVKTQGLLNMQTFGIHPRVAIQTSDLFSDAQQVYVDSKPYIEKMWNLKNDSGDSLGMQEPPEGNPTGTVTEEQNKQNSFNNLG